MRVLMNPRIALPTLRAFWKTRSYGGNDISSNGRRTATGSIRQKLCALEFVRRWLRNERLIRHRGRWIVNSFVTPFPGKAYERFLDNFLPNQPLTPLSAFLALTANCPANCSYCSLKGRRLGQDLTTEQWLTVIDQTLQLGTSLIAFSGGEPLLREDLPDLVRAAHAGGAEVQLFTSGIGATRPIFETLRNAGLWAVGVSLDRTDEASVNKQAGTSLAFQSAVSAIEMAHDSGIYTFINAIADLDAVMSGEHRRLYDLARRLKVHELRLIEPLPCGGLSTSSDHCFLGPEHIAELRRFHREVNRRGRLPKVCAFNEIESPELFGCVAGTLHFYVDPTGEVCPCDFTPLSFGNVLSERLDVIWRRMSGALGLPRRYCFMKENVENVRRYAATHGVPLPAEISCQIAESSPFGPLPDYFKVATKPFGFPRIRNESEERL